MSLNCLVPFVLHNVACGTRPPESIRGQVLHPFSLIVIASTLIVLSFLLTRKGSTRNTLLPSLLVLVIELHPGLPLPFEHLCLPCTHFSHRGPVRQASDSLSVSTFSASSVKSRCEPAWPGGKALGWYAEGLRFDSVPASAHLSLQTCDLNYPPAGAD